MVREKRPKISNKFKKQKYNKMLWRMLSNCHDASGSYFDAENKKWHSNKYTIRFRTKQKETVWSGEG